MYINTGLFASQVRIAANRLSKFLRSDELDLTAVEQLPSTDPNVVVVNKGTFTWTKGEPACLHKIDLTIPAGQLIAVVGQVGTGKSSLCAAIIGLMEKVSGNIACKVGYCHPLPGILGRNMCCYCNTVVCREESLMFHNKHGFKI